MPSNGGEPRLGRYMLELVPDKYGFEELRALTERSRAACAEVTTEDVEVRFLRSVFMPEDGTCLLLFDATSAPALAEAGRRAALPVGRVSVLLQMPDPLAPIQ